MSGLSDHKFGQKLTLLSIYVYVLNKSQGTLVLSGKILDEFDSLNVPQNMSGLLDYVFM